MKISHGLEYIAFWFLVRLVQIMPGRLADLIAVLLGKLSYAVLTSRRRIARDNLRRAFGDSKTEAEYDTIIRKVFINISRTTIEFARQPILNKQKILGMFTEVTGREHLDEALEKGKGVIFVTGHFGSWELLGAWLSTVGYPTDFLVGRQHNRYVDNLLDGFRAALGVGRIPVGVAARHVLKSLKSNRIVAMISDQHSSTGGVIVQFFGRPASTPAGPATFSVKTGCPLILGILVRENYNQHRVVISPPIYPPDSGDSEKDTIWVTQQYTLRLEDIVRQYPDQWMWTHRRWKVD
jgi:Kdo2-lipid IVA lauroyltransferase/acyltransferase